MSVSWECPKDGTVIESDGTGHVVCECGRGFDYEMAGISGPQGPSNPEVAAEVGLPWPLPEVEGEEDCFNCSPEQIREFARRFPELARIDIESGAHGAPGDK